MSLVAAAAVDPELSLASFRVRAQADPGVMPRVLELFAKRGLIPSSWRSWTSGPGDERLTIDIEMRDLAPDLADYIAACLRQIASIDAVERHSRQL